MKLRVLVRLVRIQRVLLRHRLDDLVRATHLYRPLRLLLLLSPGLWRARQSSGARGENLRLALIELGPIFVKFGQAVSTRRDLLPPDIADELAKLQDRVPPFPGSVARAGLELSYGRPLTEMFAQFEETPLAAASIAQVHGATLPGGQDVIVKVLRPGVRAQIERDLELFYALAHLAEKYWTESRRVRPVEVVAEYEKTVLDELDLMREAGNASQLKRNFAGSDLLHVPAVFWDHCRVDVLVIERIHGVVISDMQQLRAIGTDFRKLAENGVRIFFTQVFRHNFFHADMHPGNIFVLVEDPANPRYAAIDFGIVGTLDVRDQYYLASNFLAVLDRDYHRVATLHVESGWVPANTRVADMEAAVRTVCEPIFNRPLKEISYGHVLLRLFEIARRFDMVIQPQLILLQKTLINVEGLGRELYPDLDVWSTAGPVLRGWMRERIGPRALVHNFRKQLPDMLEVLNELPAVVKDAVRQSRMARGGVPLDESISRSVGQILERSARRREAGTIGSALLLGGLIWLGLGREAAWPGWSMLVLGAGWILVGRRR
ncbi:MAG TPA: ubiquinone biosynthesis regulatory protein kinase UbiB [Steroidobacteraceae bacterium]